MLNIRALNQQFEWVNPARFWNDKLDTLINNLIPENTEGFGGEKPPSEASHNTNRDAKQFTGLTHCQSRKKESLDFAFNMSLSSINVARAFARSCGVHLSVSNVKTLIHNADMIQRFIRMSGKRPHRLLNTNDFKELLYYGVSDAA